MLLQAYFMLDEMLIAGELQEPSKKVGYPAAAVPLVTQQNTRMVWKAAM